MKPKLNVLVAVPRHALEQRAKHAIPIAAGVQYFHRARREEATDRSLDWLAPERSSKPKILFRNFFMNDRGKNAGPVDVSSAFGDEVIVFAPVLEPPPRRQRLRLEAGHERRCPGRRGRLGLRLRRR